MEIVPVDKIPKLEEIVDTPLDDLLAVYKVCQQMADLCERENGIGLAAAQVGIPWRLYTIKNADGNFEFIVNGDYEPVGEEKAVSVEGCLSLKRNGKLRFFRVERWKQVRVTGSLLLEGADGRLELKEVNYCTHPNIYNVAYQHETDHARGILISDIGEEIEVSIGGNRAV